MVAYKNERPLRVIINFTHLLQMLHIHFLVYLLLTILPTLCVLPEDDSSCYHQCFHQPAEACPSPESMCRCRQLPNCKRAAVCCDVNKFTLTEGLGCGNINADGQVEALHIRNATLDALNLTQPVWRRLRYMTITNGQINSVVGEFAKHTIVSCLNLSSNGIRKFEQRSLVNLFNLSYLDLSYNNLSEVPRFKKEGIVTLGVSDNPSMLCSSLMDTLKRTEINFDNDNSTFCLSSPTNFQWFKTIDRLPLSQVIGLYELEENCLENCTCEPYRLEFVMDKPPIFSVAVNCSGIKLLSLPTHLPASTIYLNVTNNNITSLRELSDNSYQYLRHLYADNNQISSIQPLEGTKFMNNFDVLSLRNNKIKTFETYLLSNIKFYRTNNGRRINLGLNKLHCDCKTAKEFKRKRVKVVFKIVELVVAVVETLEHIYSKVIVIKQKWHVYARPHHMLQTEEEVLDIVEDDPSTSTREIARQSWLLTKLDHFPDYEEIQCEDMDVKITELDQTKLCQSQQDWTDYIYYIITAEVLLLGGLIAKVSYDYWVFKTAGYLPWPASKMPKLPCDWLCE
ncbi:hypothetical protein NQ317_011630 [Molorchus minor]|uniref:Protein halfway n=1 Tax=Molorchus minor TaxID=1323400 RepID=A0ABQ9J4A6_9CUCU|nr:hypothetical protein NQ317_011630 [Molorchus minor]